MANVTSNLCWFVVTKTYKDISTQLGLFVPFFLYGSVCIFGFIFIYVFLPETRGRSPEETAKAFGGFGPITRRTGCKSVYNVVCDCCLRHAGQHSDSADAETAAADAELNTPLTNNVIKENHDDVEGATDINKTDNRPRVRRN